MRNSGTVGGYANLPYKVVDYAGGETDTAIVNVDRENKVISVDVKPEANVVVIDLNSLMSSEEISELANFLAGLDEELEKEFLFSELIPVSDYLEHSQIKLQYSLLGGEPSGIILNKKYETEGDPQFIYEDLEAGITLKLFDGGLTASRAVPVDAYTKEESDVKYQTKLNNENKLPAGYVSGLADVAYTGKTSSLDNDSGFITASALDGYATEDYVDDAIAGLGTVFTIKGSVESISDLPDTENNIGDVYYVEDEFASFVWIEKDGAEQWQRLGSSIDLDNYVTQEDFTAALRVKQDIPPIDEDEYLIIPAPIFSANTLRSTIEGFEAEFVEKFISDDTKYMDNFGEVWRAEPTAENSANIILIVGDKKYTTSVSIESDIEDIQVVVGEITVNDVAAKSDIPTSTSQLTNDSGFITSSALSGYATEAWVGSQGYATQSWVINSSYATESWVSNQGYATSSQLSSYATTSQLSSYATQSALSSAINDITVVISEYGKTEVFEDAFSSIFGFASRHVDGDQVYVDHLDFNPAFYSAIYSLQSMSAQDLAKLRMEIYAEDDLPIVMDNFMIPALDSTALYCNFNYYGHCGRVNGIMNFVFTSYSCVLDVTYGVYNVDLPIIY